MATYGDSDPVAPGVARGAHLCDRMAPGWAERVERPIDMETSADSMPGQLAPAGTDPDEAFDVALGLLGIRVEDAADYGFDPSGWAGFDDLDEMWAAERAARIGSAA
jgi:hypothetical protein